MTLFEVVAAAGAVPGREHLRVGRSAQDGHAVRTGPDLAVVVVTDGCSSGAASEVGARLFADVLVRLVAKHAPALRSESDAAAFAGAVTTDLVTTLEALAGALDHALPEPARPSRAAQVERFFLFGFLAAVLTPDVAVVFGVGDGVVVTEDAVTVLDPGPDNAPPYPAYAVLGRARDAAARVHVARPAAGVRWLAVATDGLAELPQGELVALASDARLAQNPSLLGKRLRVLSEGAGRFRDDATIAVLVRRSP